MIPVLVDYATPSVFESDRDRALLGIAANARRPVRFHGKVARNTFLLRIALRALGEAIWSDDTWASKDDYLSFILDPVITVHPDRIFFEAFSQDQSVYASVIVDPAMFETEGEVRTGTTNIDFTAWLWAALAELRSSRETWLRVESGGFEVRTRGAGGRYEKKVDLPDPWVRGFLQLQGAMAMPGTRINARAVDLLSAIRYLRYTKAKVSPRGLRYEFEPDKEARIVLEPWEHVVPLRGTEHNYTEPRSIRTWGRRRLSLIEPLLPFANGVDIYLKGRALPSFYAVKLPGITFVLGLSGWSSQQWTDSGSFHLLTTTRAADETLVDNVHRKLSERYMSSEQDLARILGRPIAEISHAAVTLCRRGRAIYDVEARVFRHRELFETPIDEKKLYPPDPRAEKAQNYLQNRSVSIASCHPQETRKIKKLKSPDGPLTREIVYREWLVEGQVAETPNVSIVVNDSNRIIFGTCACEFFRENLLNKGPCEHMLALFRSSEEGRKDLQTSIAAAADAAPPTRPPADTDEEGEETETEDVDDEDENEKPRA